MEEEGEFDEQTAALLFYTVLRTSATQVPRRYAIIFNTTRVLTFIILTVLCGFENML